MAASRHLIVFLVTLAGAASLCHASEESIRRVIKSLDKAIDKRYEYINHRQTTIDSLKNEFRLTGEADLLLKIGEAYTSFETDSALVYFHKATIPESDTDVHLSALLQRASLLPLSGFYEVAIKSFEKIDTSTLKAPMKIVYHENGRRLYSYLASAYEMYPAYRNFYLSKALAHQSDVLHELDKESDDYLFNLGEYYFLTEDSVRAHALLTRLCETSGNRNLLARAHHHLSTLSVQRGDKDAFITHLAMSAIADIESATLEVKSLQELGTALYYEGDIDRSYRYLTIALDNAVKCGANLRMIESSRSLPIIENAHLDKVMASKSQIYIVIAIMGALVFGLAVTLGLLYRKIRQLNSVQKRLRNANSSKDIYIGQFLHLCSIYMDKLNSFCKIAERKISTGKTDELYRMTKSGKFIEEENADFYNVFDDAFLHLYPDFVDRVNELLQEDQQIKLAPDERLNTDLRILAIKRMGIDDAASIAQILNFSLNTIYAYRNRLKSRALNRDTFEDDIMKIAPQT